MFFGEFEYRVDEKGRVLIPPRFRGEFREGIVLTPGVDKCINAYPISGWKKLAAALTSGSVDRSKLRRLNRAIFATAFNIGLDGQGRIALPDPLLEYAQIEDEVVIVGVNTYLELWNTEQWEVEKATSLEQAGQIIETLEGR